MSNEKCDWCEGSKELRIVKSNYLPYNICWDCVAELVKCQLLSEDCDGLIYRFTSDRLDKVIMFRKNHLIQAREVSQ